VGEVDWPKLTTAAGRLSEAPIYIDDTPAISVLEMKAKARRLKAEHGLGLVILDYLQLMRGRGPSREQEISEISRSLKSLAKELEVPVVALSQLNRQVEARSDRRPQLADLRESGAIEQDADVIMFIYRDEVYNKSEDNPEKGLAEVIVGKQRNGPTGLVKLSFLKEYTRFENLAWEKEDY
jgi:replicative DNA helicase